MGLITRLVELGATKTALSYEQRHRVMLSNKIFLIIATSAMPYYVIFKYVANAAMSYMVIPVVVSLLFGMALNHRHRYTGAKITLIASTNLTILFYALAFGRDANIQLVYFALVGIPFVIFDIERRWIIVLNTIIPIILMLYLELSEYTRVPQVPLKEPFDGFIYLTVICVTFFVIVASAATYSYANAQHIAKITHEQHRKELDLMSDETKIKTLNNVIVTLRHIINNQLVVVTGHAAIIQQDTDDDAIRKLSQDISRTGYAISGVLKKVSQIKRPAETEYAHGITMLDLDRSEYNPDDEPIVFPKKNNQ
jgi:hypothetical protein